MRTLLSCLMIVCMSAAAAAQSARPPDKTTPRPVGTAGGDRETPAANGSADQQGAPAQVGADYRLVPGDKLRIEVYKDPQVSQSVQVRPDGKITIPLANDVVAAGRTPGELRDAIAESLKPFISNPTVTVIVVETMPPLVYVMGEVNSPGPQQLVGRMDIIQALSAAGGFKDFANTKNIKVRRGSQMLEFNYNDAIRGRTQTIQLQPGDTIIVP